MARAYLYLLRDHLRRSHGAGLRIHLTLLLILLWTNIIMASTNSREGVCGSIDVRNYPSSLMKLENCTVIEGSLHILLIDNGTAVQYENMSFPKLREITDHLLVYRAAGITNLGKLFPNLAVIRGRELFDNYALVIRQVTSLRLVGLSNLRVIVRGSVRIEQNPHLCYVDTINWGVIAPAGREDLYFKNNKATDCSSCHSQCPTSGGKALCWNRNVCQKICSSGCAHGACGLNDTQFCCDSNCLGGCTGEGPQACFSCKRVYFEGRCREKCPDTHYMINQRRCITRQECLDLGNTPRAIRKNLRYIPFDGDGEKVCRTDCPKGYMRREGRPHMCVPCEGPCPKICNGTFIITSVSTAQPCSGCTIIEGSLTIKIDKGGANVAKALEDSLKDLEEVRDYVKITLSRSLITLHFLRKLRTIHGEKLDRKHYSLIVIGNPNLQELLPLENSTNKLTIKKGKVSVHQNPKLCFYKIKEMVQRTDIVELRNQTKWDDLDMSPLSNGDRVACSQTKLNVTVNVLYSTMVIIQWENFQNMLSDSRSLLNYLIYYKKTKYNVTKFEGRDACSSNDWKIKDHDGNGDQNELFLLTELMPYSRYALYIEALMIRGEEQGAHSDIVYFTTKMSTPSPPVDVTTLSRSDDEVMITWHPPKTPNGLIHSYIVRGVREPDEILPERNYCEDPLSSSVDPSRKLPLDESTSTSQVVGETSFFANISNDRQKNECCSCTRDKDVEDRESEKSSEIAFENALQDSVYVKNENSSTGKTKRSIRSVNQSNEIQTLELGRIKNDTNKELNTSDRFERVVTDQAMVIVQNLTHFSNYLIEVVACLEHAPENASKCSTRSIASVRTLPKSGADTIDWSTVSFQIENGTNVLYVRWDEPLAPNGGIVVYGLEYGTSDKPLFTHCIKRSEYLKYKGYKLSSLQPGNYSFRLRAQSFAGWGEWSRSVYHEIPSNENNWRTVIIAMIFTFLTCIAIIFGSLWVFVKRKLRGQIPHGIEYVSVNPEYISAGYSYEPDEWEVSRDKIKLIKELGQGSFGMVFEGEFEQEPDKFMRCAVKTVNDNASHRDRHNFLQEATVMKAFKCHHVVRLIGVVSVGHPVYVLMEIMSNGDLRSYLRSHRLDNEEAIDPQPPSLAQLLRMAAEIADGMAYLAAKKFVHRDLAARNCMVADDLTVKIGDFGMTRDIYETDYYRKGGKGLLPVRWMAPESLKDGVFTSQSDVWSYGVVLWEMATLASQPYQGLSNEQVLKYVINGGTMEQPENCPERLYTLMSLCWARNTKARPTFTEIIEMLLPDINGSKFREVSYYFTIRPQMHKKSSHPEEIDPSTPLKSDLKQSEEESSFSDSEDGADASFHYFPSRMLPVSENVEEETLQIEETEKTENSVLSESNGVNKVNPKMLNENSKSTSDGSKGSKVSTTTSNGSLANGHLPRYNTTMC